MAYLVNYKKGDLLLKERRTLISKTSESEPDCVACDAGLKVTHVVVTTGQLIPTLAKLMLFKLSGMIPPENVYSARAIGKSACFDRIWLRFGEAAKFCVIGAHSLWGEVWSARAAKALLSFSPTLCCCCASLLGEGWWAF